MKKIYFLICLYATHLNAQSLSIFPSSDELTRPRIKFDIKNESTQDYFCRSIKLNDVNYNFKDTDEYFYSEDAIVNNKYINKNSAIYYLDENTNLNDILGLTQGRDLYSTFDKEKLNFDCEPKASRMNNIFVLDECNGNLSLNILNFDGPNANLNRIEKKLSDLSKEAKFFKINSKDLIVIDDLGKIFVAELKNQKILTTQMLQNLKQGEKTIAAFSFSENNLSIATYSLDKGILFFFYEKNNQNYRLINQYNLPKFSLTVKEENYSIFSGINNFDEIRSFYRGQLQNIIENMSIYSRNLVSSKNFELVISTRLPSAGITIKEIKNGEWKYKLIPIDIYENVIIPTAYLKISYFSDLKFNENENYSMKNAEDLLNENVFLREGQNNNLIRYKDYQLFAKDSKIFIGSESSKNIMNDFCSIKGIFTDLTISSGEFDINQRYEGRPMLIMAIRNKKYDDIVKILALGASVNAVDVLGHSPLFYAMELLDIKIIELLLENGADINKKHDGESYIFRHISKVVIDWEILNIIEKKETIKQIQKIYQIFKKYNYIISKDNNFEKIKKLIMEVTDNKILFDSLEIKI